MAKGPFGDLSGRQLIAGALAAMTSAWMASWLGVAGTLIGAAVGSVVAGIASALYQASIDRGIQRSKNLLTAEQLSARKSGKGGDGPVQDGVEGEKEEADSSGATSWKERLRRINWRSVAIASAATLLAAIVVIGAYEMITGKSYGRSSNPTIVPTSVTRGGGEHQTPNPTGQTPEQGDPDTVTPEEPTESAPTGGAPTTPAPTGGAPTGEAPAEPGPAPQGGGEGPTTP